MAKPLQYYKVISFQLKLINFKRNFKIIDVSFYLKKLENKYKLNSNRLKEGFPGGSVVKNPPANAGDPALIAGS